MIDGQEKLISFIDNFTLNTLPHSILLLGEEGSGQTDVCRYIADKFSMLELDISEKVNQETIDNICLASSEPTIYTINMNKVTEKEQNVLLKLFEEPNFFTYIILIAETSNKILDTIINRSYQFNMCKYTKDQLYKFLTVDDEESKELILSTCHTPGQIEIANHTDVCALYTLCENILDKIDKANFYNTLSISDKINFKDEYSKYDLKLFIRMLSLTMVNKNKYDFYPALNTLVQNIDFMLDKKSYFENFLLTIWKRARI